MSFPTKEVASRLKASLAQCHKAVDNILQALPQEGVPSTIADMLEVNYLLYTLYFTPKDPDGLREVRAFLSMSSRAVVLPSTIPTSRGLRYGSLHHSTSSPLFPQIVALSRSTHLPLSLNGSTCAHQRRPTMINTIKELRAFGRAYRPIDPATGQKVLDYYKLFLYTEDAFHNANTILAQKEQVDAFLDRKEATHE